MASCSNRRMLICCSAILAVGFIFLALTWSPSLSRTQECPNLGKIPYVDLQIYYQATLPSSTPTATATETETAETTETDLPLPLVKAVNSTSVIQDKFTVVMQSYKRDDLLHRLLEHYCKIKLIDRIIIVWNNVNTSVPKFLQNLKCGRERFFLKQDHNTIRNRFQPFPQIRTESVISLDDDRLISEQDLEFAFNVWKKWKHLIVGWLPRVHTEIDTGNGTEYHYSRSLGKKNTKYSMILTGECFLHTAYLKLFNSSLPESIRDMIDDMQSCEDIAMNVLVAQHLAESGHPQCPGLLVNHQKPIQNLEKKTASEYKGLWRRPNDINTRHNCLNKLAEEFGDLYLRYSDIMIDSSSVYKHQD